MHTELIAKELPAEDLITDEELHEIAIERVKIIFATVLQSIISLEDIELMRHETRFVHRSENVDRGKSCL